MTPAFTAVTYVAAALAEIAGCFAMWSWLRSGASALWLVPGLASLALFAFLLTLVPVEAAGRAYAAYGGVYIAASLGWWRAADRTAGTWPAPGSASSARRSSCGRRAVPDSGAQSAMVSAGTAVGRPSSSIATMTKVPSVTLVRSWRARPLAQASMDRVIEVRPTLSMVE